jgi:lipid-A-disaccharide synthase
VGLDPRRPVLALFPGSRAQEVRRHLELFSAAAERVVARRPEVQPVVGVPGGIDRDGVRRRRWPLVDAPRGCWSFADAAIAKSGTTTLEAALALTPLVVAYRMNPLSWQMAKRLVKVPHIALANLIAEERVAPEFVQDAGDPGGARRRRAPAAGPPLARAGADGGGVPPRARALGGPGASRRVAALAAELLEGR